VLSLLPRVDAAAADDVHARDRTAAAAAAAAAAAEVAVGRGCKRKRKQAEKQSKQQQKARKDEEFGVTRGIDFKGVRSIINFDIPDSVQVCYFVNLLLSCYMLCYCYQMVCYTVKHIAEQAVATRCWFQRDFGGQLCILCFGCQSATAFIVVQLAEGRQSHCTAAEELVSMRRVAAAVHLQGYVHRVGRTGRAGQSGLALTLFTPQDDEFREQLQQALQVQQQSAAAAVGGPGADGSSSSSSSDDDSSDVEEEGGGGRASKRKAAQDGQVSGSDHCGEAVEPLLRRTPDLCACLLFTCLCKLSEERVIVASGCMAV
jgi:hypothetical protein